MVGLGGVVAVLFGGIVAVGVDVVPGRGVSEGVRVTANDGVALMEVPVVTTIGVRVVWLMGVVVTSVPVNSLELVTVGKTGTAKSVGMTTVGAAETAVGATIGGPIS